jgi:hypothetical protein
MINQNQNVQMEHGVFVADLHQLRMNWLVAVRHQLVHQIQAVAAASGQLDSRIMLGGAIRGMDIHVLVLLLVVEFFFRRLFSNDRGRGRIKEGYKRREHRSNAEQHFLAFFDLTFRTRRFGD